jgi:hypothetical protein
MGTRSRVIIHRRSKAPIRLWIHYDGYFSGVGDELCEQVKLLLEKYTVEQVETMLAALDLKEAEAYQNFKTEDLIAFIEGKTEYANDECGDIAFEYQLDFTGNYFSGEGHSGDCGEVKRTLTLEQIKAGAKLTDPAALLGRIDVDTLVGMFRMLSASEKAEALTRLAAIG